MAFAAPLALTVGLLLPRVGQAEDVSDADDALVFVEEDVDGLRARVRKVERYEQSGVHVSLLSIEVTNRTERHVEPLAFVVAGTGSTAEVVPEHVARRVPALDLYGRAGRAVPPKRKLTYWVQVLGELPKSPKFEIKVAEASFFDGAPVDEPPVTVGKREEARVDDAGGPRRVVRLPLENTLDCPVDALLRVSFTRPAKGDRLIHVALRANQATTHELEILPSAPPFTALGGGMYDVSVSSVEVVDWSVRRGRGRDQAEGLLDGVARSWRRWPSTVTGATGRIEWKVEGGSEPGSGRADFTYAVGAEPELRHEGGPSAHTASHVRDALAHAFSDLGPIDWDAWTGASGVRLVASGERPLVQLSQATDGVPLLGFEHRFLRLSDGRVVQSAFGLETWGWWTDWTTAASGDGWIVTERLLHRQDPDKGPVSRLSYRYDETDGVLLPKELVWFEERPFGPDVTTTLTFSAVEFDGDAPSPERREPPTGPVAERVRVAWDAIRRLVDDPVELVATFEIDHPGTGDEWLGRKPVEGELRLFGFRGTTWERAEVTFDERTSASDARALAGPVEGRLRQWSARDPQGLPDFDEAFAGATFAAEGDRIHVEGADITELTIRDDRVIALSHEGGRHQEFDWRSVDDEWVPTEIRSSNEGAEDGWDRCRVRFRRIDDRVVPVEIELVEMFGSTSGTEVIRLRDLRIE